MEKKKVVKRVVRKRPVKMAVKKVQKKPELKPIPKQYQAEISGSDELINLDINHLVSEDIPESAYPSDAKELPIKRKKTFHTKFVLGSIEIKPVYVRYGFLFLKKRFLNIEFKLSGLVTQKNADRLKVIEAANRYNEMWMIKPDKR